MSGPILQHAQQVKPHKGVAMQWSKSFCEEHPDIAAVINKTQTAIAHILKENLVSLSIVGSLALGDFHEESSDIDLLAFTQHELSKQQVSALQAAHDHVRQSSGGWASRIEVVYLPLRVCRKTFPEQEQHYILYTDGKLALSKPRTDWVVQQHIAQQWGVPLLGQSPRVLLSPVDAYALRASTRNSVPFVVPPPENQQRARTTALHVLSMGRVFYTKLFGKVVSKPHAAQWAMTLDDGRWKHLFRSSLQQRSSNSVIACIEAYEFINEINRRISLIEQ